MTVARVVESGASSVHQGDWKLIRLFHDGDDGIHRYLLFNLRDDIGEQHNLADEHHERLENLSRD